LRRLSNVTNALASAATIDDVGAVIVRVAGDALHATSGYFATVDDAADELVMRAQFGYPDWIVRKYERVSLDAAFPGCAAARHGTSIFIESDDDRRAQFPNFPEDPAHASFVVVPITEVGQTAAVVAFGFAAARRFDDDDRSYVATVIQACAQALRRAAAFEAEHQSRAQLRTLLDASEELAGLDDPDRVVEAIARIAATRIGSWATVFVVEAGGGFRRVSERGSSSFDASRVRAIENALEADDTARKVLATGQPAITGGIEGEPTSIAVPMAIADRTLAVLVVADLGPHAIGPTQVELALDLGRRGASALERARFFQSEQERAAAALRESEARVEAEHRLVELLQRTIVPESLPEVEGIELAAGYRPAEILVDVGGDWYDAFVVPDGKLVLVVGDVAGHGVGAASLMGRVRNALRAYAVEDADAASILRRLDGLLHTLDEFAMVTAFIACYDSATREMSWSRAGHPPALLVGPDGRAEFLDTINGAPLGTMARQYVTCRTVLEPGALLVGYTDGLVERRDRIIDDGLNWLADRSCEQAHEPLDTLCTSLLDAPFVPHPSPDDMCVLALRVLPA
jgi:serine phosphatase RsbU (regulator of sigma subunit)/putative methionine-R-sulfoxide reductase with GAF domain